MGPRGVVTLAVILSWAYGWRALESVRKPVGAAVRGRWRL